MTILTYHAIDPGWRAPLSVPPELFARQLAWLHRTRPIVPLDDAVPAGRLGRPTRSIALTFDDAFTSVHEHAMPVLERLRIPATIFLIAKTLDPHGGARDVDWVDRPPAHPLAVMDATQVKELQAAGVRFGSHSYGHQDLTTLGYEACLEDLRRSRAVLEDLPGVATTRRCVGPRPTPGSPGRSASRSTNGSRAPTRLPAWGCIRGIRPGPCG
jgi:peptidoglycan/xylan/chitin deacetylase (PgdA/CDA1 family)